MDRAKFERGLAGLAAGDASVNLGLCGLGDAEAARVAEAVKASSTLTELVLAGGFTTGDSIDLVVVPARVWVYWVCGCSQPNR